MDKTDLQEAGRLMEEMHLEYGVSFDLDGDAEGWRCGAWSEDDCLEESMLVVSRVDMPASKTAVEAVKLCVEKLAKMNEDLRSEGNMSGKLYAGADWLARQYKDLEISKLGRNVADILGQVYFGLYHLDDSALFNKKRTDWADDSRIVIVVPGRLQMTGIDTLVTCCMERKVYVEIEGAAPNYMRLRFYRYCGDEDVKTAVKGH